MLTCKEAAALIGGWDDILVICHENPDGDALGSMSGLVRGLRSLGKRAQAPCPRSLRIFSRDLRKLTSRRSI